MKNMKPLETIYWLRLGFGILAAVLSVGLLLIAGAINTNLVPNPSVEAANSAATSPQNWSPSGNGTEWSMTYARTGSRSLSIYVSNTSAEWKEDVFSVVGGNTYHASGFFYGQMTSGEFLLTMRWFSNSGGLTVGEDNLTLPVANYAQWQLEGNDFTAPSSAKSCALVFRAVNGSGDLYGDDFEVRKTESSTSFFNSAAVALIVYIASYYLLKSKFAERVAKPQKILTAGIGIYFLAWIVFWALLYAMFAG